MITRQFAPWQALLLGTVTVAGLDILDAIVFFGFRGIEPIVIFQSIASGIMGPSSYDGGLTTALLGGLLHVLISFAIVSVYFVLSRRISGMRHYPVRWGLCYGVIVYGVMNFIVLPLSAASSGLPPLAVFLNGILIHMFGVGLPSALFAGTVVHPD